ncbi:MAG TPA: 8-amino-7-oxononanoate synthase [Gemmataceae bacterium]|nr:8-amino-7-oxononanoate synthase [Gemmataceae bacterium]
MSLHGRWSALLDRLRSEGRVRELSLPRGIDFSSNDYLGYGASSASSGTDSANASLRSGMASRLLRGHQAIWEEVESALARWHGAEAALVMTSGYAANEGLLSTAIEPHDWVASDAFNHASIIDGLRLAGAERFVYRHLDLNHLEAGLQAAMKTSPGPRQRFVVTESLFGMDGDTAPLDELVRLAERYGAWVIVDEAHSTGCFGREGAGVIDAAGLRARILASVHTGGKALGVAGAYICGSALLKNLLINRCRHFMFTTALPGAVGAWWLDTLRRVQADHAGRQSLHEAAAIFRSELARHGIPALGSHYIVPVVRGEDRRAVQAANRLQQEGWDIRAIRPPSVPPGSARLRISIHADHPQVTLAAAAAAVAEAIKDSN